MKFKAWNKDFSEWDEYNVRPYDWTIDITRAGNLILYWNWDEGYDMHLYCKLLREIDPESFVFEDGDADERIPFNKIIELVKQERSHSDPGENDDEI